MSGNLANRNGGGFSRRGTAAGSIERYSIARMFDETEKLT
jgi:hypothetical protein